MSSFCPLTFLNVDLAVYADEMPKKIMRHLKDEWIELYSGDAPVESGYKHMASFEVMETPDSETKVIHAFVNTIRQLSGEAKKEWQALPLKVFDFGYECSTLNDFNHVQIHPNLLNLIAQVGGSIAISIYHPCKNSGQRDLSQHSPKQGELYWLCLPKAGESGIPVPHPHVVIQDDLFNQSRLDTVVLCALTSNRKRAQEPGNVLLEAGEAGLAKSSVVVVSQLETACKSQLGGYIGTLSPERVAQILAGLRFQQRSFFGYHSD